MGRCSNPWVQAMVTVAVCFFAACVTFLISRGQSVEVVSTVTGLAGVLVSGGSLIYGKRAHAAAATAVTQTNGSLDARIQSAIEQALVQHQERINGGESP